jgi:Peroxisomal biogenesis factor 11 (PEX11)
MAWYTLSLGHKDQVDRYRLIAGKQVHLIVIEQFRDARSVFRLSKTIFEVKRIKLIAQKTDDKFGMIVNILSRALYGVFWFFDNIYILLKMLNVWT